ncbi:hypothetical protein CFP56_036427 [Quercus suber]|uniref:Uncharacterized protein n=1 Tax=Quercus suber TaxID=58331 RepID=A0AAW0LRC7_QUESU
MYGMRIYTNGIWVGRHLSNVVRLWVSAGSMASVISRMYLFVLARLDSDQGIQEIGTYMTIKKGVREEILYNAQMTSMYFEAKNV